MDEPPRERKRGPGWIVPGVLLLIIVLLVVGMFRREQGEPQPSPPAPPVLTSANAFLDCTDCHADLDSMFKAGEKPDLLFTHEAHFSIGVSDCAACHVANTHEPDGTNVPTMVTCYQCHTLENDARAPGDCGLCHPPNMNPEPQTHFADAWLPEEHSAAALANPFDCATCHQQQFCNDCHGLELPHPEGFTDLTHAEQFFEDPALCDRCHPREPLVRRDTCDTCHHPEGPESSTWIEVHPSVVRDRSANTCFRCHADDTCRACHNQGPENFTNEDLAADEALLTAMPEPEPSPTATPSPSGG